MSKHNKTLAEIVAILRANARGERFDAFSFSSLADRIEAAAKRERSQSWHHREMEELVLRHERELADARMSGGNAAKLREALKLFVEYSELVCRMGIFTRDRLVEITTKARAALSAPPRQCDVGTAEEQVERMGAFCSRCGKDADGAYRCENCNLLRMDRCELAWAQMPYEANESEAKG